MSEKFTDKVKRLGLGDAKLPDMIDEIDDLRKDKKRLDWLELSTDEIDLRDYGWTRYDFPDQPTIRDFIDNVSNRTD